MIEPFIETASCQLGRSVLMVDEWEAATGVASAFFKQLYRSYMHLTHTNRVCETLKLQLLTKQKHEAATLWWGQLSLPVCLAPRRQSMYLRNMRRSRPRYRLRPRRRSTGDATSHSPPSLPQIAFRHESYSQPLHIMFHCNCPFYSVARAPCTLYTREPVA